MSRFKLRSLTGNMPSSPVVVFTGGSITRAPNYISFYDQIQWWLPYAYPGSTFSISRYAEDGTPSFVRLIDYHESIEALSPDLIVIDAVVNDGGSNDTDGDHADGWAGASEALIRLIRTNLPNCAIVAWSFVWPESYSFISSARIDALRKWQDLARRYDFPLLDLAQATQRALGTNAPNDAQVETYYESNDIHPIQIGHDLAVRMLRSTLAPWLGASVPSQQWTGSLGDYPRIWTNSDDYERPLQIVTASSMTATGSWTIDGTDIYSSTPGDTLKYTATWAGSAMKFGNTGTFRTRYDSGTWSSNIDNGAFLLDTRRKLQNAALGSHEIEIEVVSGTVRAKTLYLI